MKASISAPAWLLSTPPLLITTDDVCPKMPMPVGPPVTVTLEPGPEMSMLAETRRAAGVAIDPICSVPPLITESVPPMTLTPPNGPLPPTVSEPPLIVSPPAKQSHSVRSPPMVPMLPPLLAPVSVRLVPMLSSSSEPAPEKLPENVVLLLPTMARSVPGSVGPIITAPPPASEPISVTVPPSPSASVAPAPTLKAGLKEEVFTVPPLIVKVAALPMANE